MKRFLYAALLLALICCLCSCLPRPINTAPAGSATPTAQAATPTPTATDAQSPLASPSATPNVEGTGDPLLDQIVLDMAMQRDIDLMKAQSEGQQGHEANYKGVKKEQWLTVETVTSQEIKFAGKPQVFKGVYTGQFTADRKYQYYEDASAGGKRYYNVKDNFGVWITFKYEVPF